MPASELLDELIAALGLAPLPSEVDRHYLERFVQFVKEWERKSEGNKLRDFLEYLFYFGEAHGDIHLETELSDDAVQLMTVHSAKGLEYPHVFVLRLSKNDFPSGQRKPEFEFPPELMKEEKPEGDFHIQEERRLFYVALTRAQPAADAGYRGEQTQAAIAVPGRFFAGAEDSEARCRAIITQD